jgi:hypothetical protein
MKKFNPILAASILLLSASAQADTYNNESNVKSGVSVAWFGQDVADWYLKAEQEDYKKNEKNSHPERVKKRKEKSAGQHKKLMLIMDQKLRERANREYDHRHASHKHR